MLKFPNAKINLDLRIRRKREDGYHDLESVFIPVTLHDIIECLPAPSLHIEVSGLKIQGDIQKNLVWKACKLMEQVHGFPINLTVFLHKAIPAGGGLGGGSSDASFMLSILRDLFHPELSDHHLAELALQIGSDCPFFLLNRPCIASGRGEQLTPIDIHLPEYEFLLVFPGIHISTPWAFSQSVPGQSPVLHESAWQLPVHEWKHHLVNDFESIVFPSYPVLSQIKQALYDTGALFASMSGSGSTFFGIFKNETAHIAAEIMQQQFSVSSRICRILEKH